MSGPEQASREATLEAVHSDQLTLQEQLETLSNLLTQVEEFLMGGPHAQMLGAAAAQAKATLGNPIALGPIDTPPAGKLPQMCELGVKNGRVVGDLLSRLTHLSGLLGVPKP